MPTQNNQPQNGTTQNSELQITLTEINRHLKKIASYRHNFFISVLKGLGFAIGSTIVLGIFIAVLVRIASVFLNDLQFLENLPIQQELQQQFPEIQNYEN